MASSPTVGEEGIVSPSQSVPSPTGRVSANGPGSSGLVIRLLNSIVDVCLVYGFDETCMRDLEAEEGVSWWVWSHCMI